MTLTPALTLTRCSAGMAIDCPADTYNDVRGQTNQGACQQCPEYSASKEGSPSRYSSPSPNPKPSPYLSLSPHPHPNPNPNPNPD